MLLGLSRPPSTVNRVPAKQHNKYSRNATGTCSWLANGYTYYIVVYCCVVYTFTYSRSKSLITPTMKVYKHSSTSGGEDLGNTIITESQIHTYWDDTGD